ncbi:hypothetical protein AMTRI_Chr01g137640 [Amborella trichopoda]
MPICVTQRIWSVGIIMIVARQDSPIFAHPCHWQYATFYRNAGRTGTYLGNLEINLTRPFNFSFGHSHSTSLSLCEFGRLGTMTHSRHCFSHLKAWDGTNFQPTLFLF